MRLRLLWVSPCLEAHGAVMASPRLRIGLVADVQHADKDDGHGDGRVQFYRSAPEKLARAVDFFNQARVDCVVTLGDAIDGNVDEASTLRDLERVATQLDRLRMPAYHVLGNHCLSVERDRFLSRLGMTSSYYEAPLGEGWLLVVLDTNDLAVHGWPNADDPRRIAAERYLDAHADDGPQMTRWNGGLGPDQLMWLETTLVAAEARGDCVVVAAHHPLFDEAARPTHCAWNWADVAGRLAHHPAVKIVLAGHDHVGGYAAMPRDDGPGAAGLHFVTLEAILETTTDAYGVLNVHDTYLEVAGTGSATSRPHLAISGCSR